MNNCYPSVIEILIVIRRPTVGECCSARHTRACHSTKLRTGVTFPLTHFTVQANHSPVVHRIMKPTWESAGVEHTKASCVDLICWGKCYWIFIRWILWVKGRDTRTLPDHMHTPSRHCRNVVTVLLSRLTTDRWSDGAANLAFLYLFSYSHSCIFSKVLYW